VAHRQNAVTRFIEAMNNRDLDGVTRAFHPEFEMVVPQHPARGFKGREQEVANMEHLMSRYADGRIEILAMAETDAEVWVETSFVAAELEIAAVVIFEVDREQDVITKGRFYSERVDPGGPDINEWLQRLT
jgi:limonene-1,2-epoxide hydrolase